jgi:MFS family permease
MYSFGIILDEIKVNVQADDQTLFNLLSSLNTGFLFCSGPIVAGLVNQFGCRVVVIVGAFITACMYIITAYTSSLYVMLAAYGVVGGLTTGCTYIASLIIIPEYFDKKKGVATGITMAGSGLGSFAISPLVSFIIELTDWRFSMSICACCILQICVCGALLRPLNPRSTNNSSKSAKNPKSKLEMKNLNNTDVEIQKGQDNQQKGQLVQTYFGSVYSLNEIHVPFYERNAFLRIVVGIVKEMTDFSLLTQNLSFLLITISNFLVFTGYFTPFLYVKKLAIGNGISNTKATLILSTIG